MKISAVLLLGNFHDKPYGHEDAGYANVRSTTHHGTKKTGIE
jgi:hypothetical protein